MSKVIEILDSDDDSNYPNEAANVEKPLKSRATTAVQSKTSETISQRDLASASTSTSAANVEPSCSSLKLAGRNRSRRKSMHQPMRSSPDMYFETIALDDDDENNANSKGISSGQPLISKPKTFKTAPKILGTKTPAALAAATEDNVDTAYQAFIEAEETVSLLNQIAEERVRVNYLLASYGMPDINFSLYTQPERLQFQLEERLKQRKMRNWSDTKKRRSLLPPKTIHTP